MKYPTRSFEQVDGGQFCAGRHIESTHVPTLTFQSAKCEAGQPHRGATNTHGGNRRDDRSRTHASRGSSPGATPGIQYPSLVHPSDIGLGRKPRPAKPKRRRPKRQKQLIPILESTYEDIEDVIELRELEHAYENLPAEPPPGGHSCQHDVMDVKNPSEIHVVQWESGFEQFLDAAESLQEEQVPRREAPPGTRSRAHEAPPGTRSRTHEAPPGTRSRTHEAPPGTNAAMTSGGAAVRNKTRRNHRSVDAGVDPETPNGEAQSPCAKVKNVTGKPRSSKSRYNGCEEAASQHKAKKTREMSLLAAYDGVDTETDTMLHNGHVYDDDSTTECAHVIDPPDTYRDRDSARAVDESQRRRVQHCGEPLGLCSCHDPHRKPHSATRCRDHNVTKLKSRRSHEPNSNPEGKVQKRCRDLGDGRWCERAEPHGPVHHLYETHRAGFATVGHHRDLLRGRHAHHAAAHHAARRRSRSCPNSPLFERARGAAWDVTSPGTGGVDVPHVTYIRAPPPHPTLYVTIQRECAIDSGGGVRRCAAGCADCCGDDADGGVDVDLMRVAQRAAADWEMRTLF